MQETERKRLNEKCADIRRLIIEEIGRLGVGHIGGCLSIVEALVVLYYRQMHIDPRNPSLPDRDRFVLSKGHAGPALYAVLADRGYFDKEWLWTLNQPGTRLPSHCDRLRTPGVDMTAGSLGQGFSVAVGMAKAARMDGKTHWVYAMIGDGESQEGQIWEAAQFAGQHKLRNLIAMMDYNNMQIDGLVSDQLDVQPAVQRWESFGFSCETVDGHDVAAIDGAIQRAKAAGRPCMIVLRTIKGKGAYFAEGKVESHNMTVTEEMWRSCMKGGGRDVG
ncbi:MAG TPA: transketolase [Firmicutes bacterium]|nr:transketolase [Bacillota bacterium]